MKQIAQLLGLHDTVANLKGVVAAIHLEAVGVEGGVGSVAAAGVSNAVASTPLGAEREATVAAPVERGADAIALDRQDQVFALTGAAVLGAANSVSGLAIPVVFAVRADGAFLDDAGGCSRAASGKLVNGGTLVASQRSGPEPCNGRSRRVFPR
jgi:hypothetical protein